MSMISIFKKWVKTPSSLLLDSRALAHVAFEQNGDGWIYVCKITMGNSHESAGPSLRGHQAVKGSFSNK